MAQAPSASNNTSNTISNTVIYLKYTSNKFQLIAPKSFGRSLGARKGSRGLWHFKHCNPSLSFLTTCSLKHQHQLRQNLGGGSTTLLRFSSWFPADLSLNCQTFPASSAMAKNCSHHCICLMELLLNSSRYILHLNPMCSASIFLHCITKVSNLLLTVYINIRWGKQIHTRQPQTPREWPASCNWFQGQCLSPIKGWIASVVQRCKSCGWQD